jgi:hypothetical protein
VGKKRAVGKRTESAPQADRATTVDRTRRHVVLGRAHRLPADGVVLTEGDPVNRTIRFLGISATTGVLFLGVLAQSATATAAPATSLQNWHATGTVVFDMMDYENVGKNERCTHRIPVTNTGRIGGPPANYWYFGKCGGEIRTEIHYRLQRTGHVLKLDDISVKLFEGDSAETNALKGVRAMSTSLIWPGQGVTKRVRVQNDVDGVRDDRTIVTFTLNHR